MARSPSPAPARLRDDVRLIALVAIVVALIVLPLMLYAQRPLSRPQVTLIGHGDSLSLLLEGASGGRVLIGGGASQAEVPAALARHFWVWERQIDLLVVVDPRDLPGATELVRRGMVREVATVGIYDQLAAASALATLSDVCRVRDVPMRAFGGAQRIAVGREPQLVLTVAPPGEAAAPPRLSLQAGILAAPILVGADADDEPALGAILLRANGEIFGLAADGAARLIVAPAPPAELDVADPEGRYLLIVGAGDRVTLVIEEGALRLRGGVLDPLDVAAPRR